MGISMSRMMGVRSQDQSWARRLLRQAARYEAGRRGFLAALFSMAKGGLVGLGHGFGEVVDAARSMASSTVSSPTMAWLTRSTVMPNMARLPA
jgi:hypothetical protein